MVRVCSERINERLVICNDMKSSAFNEITKRLTTRYTANNSQSNVLYFASVSVSFFEKYDSGVHCPLMNCCTTAPTAVSEVSVMMLVGASGTG